MSAFDVVMREPIPHKGAVLTQISAFWFERLAGVVPIALRHRRAPTRSSTACRRCVGREREIAGRAMLVRRTDAGAVRVRGAWVPLGLGVGGVPGARHPRRRAAAGRAASRATRLEPPLFSPATKAESGHDENVTFARMAEALGPRR